MIMNILVGYNGSAASNAALDLAKDYAKAFHAKVYLVTSMEGGARERIDEVRKAEQDLQAAQKSWRQKAWNAKSTRWPGG